VASGVPPAAASPHGSNEMSTRPVSADAGTPDSQARANADVAPAPTAASIHFRPVEPVLLVIFGATGDLARRKLLPSLYNLARDDMLPDGFAVLGAAKEELRVGAKAPEPGMEIRSVDMDSPTAVLLGAAAPTPTSTSWWTAWSATRRISYARTRWRRPGRSSTRSRSGGPPDSHRSTATRLEAGDQRPRTNFWPGMVAGGTYPDLSRRNPGSPRGPALLAGVTAERRETTPTAGVNSLLDVQDLKRNCARRALGGNPSHEGQSIGILLARTAGFRTSSDIVRRPGIADVRDCQRQYSGGAVCQCAGERSAALPVLFQLAPPLVRSFCPPPDWS
jgi:Glucose-6-phosphate dehydrogenase, NAD binding domain